MVDPIGGIGPVWPYIIAAVIGYLFGSFPSGLILGKLAGLGDIRKIGSGNIGFTNALRTGNKWVAIGTLVLDLLKGIIPVWLGWRYGQDIAVLAALGAVMGHCFPIWLGFKGGKAVATAAGVIMMLSWPVGVAIAAVWLIVAIITRMASAAAVGACIAGPIIAWYFAHYPVAGAYHSDNQRFEIISIVALIVLIRHHANIRRLLNGTEPRFGASKPPSKN